MHIYACLCSNFSKVYYPIYSIKCLLGMKICIITALDNQTNYLYLLVNYLQFIEQ